MAIQRNNITMLKLLITYGADLNFKNYVEEDTRFEGQGLLFQAMTLKHFEIVELLVKKGIDMKYVDRYYRTPFHYAVVQSTFKIAKLLLDNGADLNAEYDHGVTPLFLAVHAWREEAVQLLIDNGADLNIICRFALWGFEDATRPVIVER